MPVTFSAGIARSVGSADETMRLADEALYRAKDAGRDRWHWADARPASARAPTDYVQPYLDDALLGRREPAVRLALGLLDRRVSREEIITDLLAAAQMEVGERWYRNELTPADEHVATGVRPGRSASSPPRRRRLGEHRRRGRRDPRRLESRPPSVGSHPITLDGAALRLFSEASSFGTSAVADLAERFPPMAAYDARQRAHTAQDLVFIVEFLAAALLVAAGHHVGHEPPPQRLLGVEDASGEQHLHGHGIGNLPLQPHGRAGTGDQAASRLGHAEARLLLGDADVGLLEHLAAAAHAVAVDGGDDRRPEPLVQQQAAP